MEQVDCAVIHGLVAYRSVKTAICPIRNVSTLADCVGPPVSASCASSLPLRPPGTSPSHSQHSNGSPLCPVHMCLPCSPPGWYLVLFADGDKRQLLLTAAGLAAGLWRWSDRRRTAKHGAPRQQQGAATTPATSASPTAALATPAAQQRQAAKSTQRLQGRGPLFTGAPRGPRASSNRNSGLWDTELQ